jgi:hypothetical protein
MKMTEAYAKYRATVVETRPPSKHMYRCIALFSSEQKSGCPTDEILFLLIKGTNRAVQVPGNIITRKLL